MNVVSVDITHSFFAFVFILFKVMVSLSCLIEAIPIFEMSITLTTDFLCLVANTDAISSLKSFLETLKNHHFQTVLPSLEVKTKTMHYKDE